MDAPTLPADRLRAALQTFTVPAGNGLPEAHFSGLDPVGAVAAHMATRDPGSTFAQSLPDLSSSLASPSMVNVSTLDAAATPAGSSAPDPSGATGGGGGVPIGDAIGGGLGPFGAIASLFSLFSAGNQAKLRGAILALVFLILGLALAIGGAYIVATD